MTATPISPQPAHRDLGSQRWRMLALLFVCRLGLGLQFQALGSVSVPMAQALHFSQAEIGTLIGAFMLPGLVLALPAGYAGRYLPDRHLAALGLLGLAAGGGIAALAQGMGLMALGRLAAGVGFVFSTIYFAKMVADWFSGEELATAMGILVMSWPFGIAMGQVGHAWIAVHFDWRSAFAAAALACLLAASLLWWVYRPPPAEQATTSSAATLASAAAMPTALSRREWVLILLAASVWGFFNAGYIVFLSFAPRVLEAAGYAVTAAAGVISLASWVMIFSGAACGQLADRTGRNDLILYVCMAVAVAALLLLPQPGWAVGLSLALGLIGVAPAGLIMALTAQAMAPHKRAFGMGVFFSFYFAVVAMAPPLAGVLFDLSGDAYGPIIFAAALFAATGATNAVFRFAQRRMPS